MQLITVFGNRKIYASIQEPAASYLFNNFKKSSRTETTRKKKKHSGVCLSERKSNQKMFSLASFGSGVV